MKNNLNKKLIGLMAVGITAGLMVCPMHVSADEGDPDPSGGNDPDPNLSDSGDTSSDDESSVVDTGDYVADLIEDADEDASDAEDGFENAADLADEAIQELNDFNQNPTTVSEGEAVISEASELIEEAREEYAEASESLENAQDALDEAQELLDIAEDNQAEIEVQLEEAQEEKESIEAEVKEKQEAVDECKEVLDSYDWIEDSGFQNILDSQEELAKTPKDDETYQEKQDDVASNIIEHYYLNAGEEDITSVTFEKKDEDIVVGYVESPDGRLYADQAMLSYWVVNYTTSDGQVYQKQYMYEVDENGDYNFTSVIFEEEKKVYETQYVDKYGNPFVESDTTFAVELGEGQNTVLYAIDKSKDPDLIETNNPTYRKENLVINTVPTEKKYSYKKTSDPVRTETEYELNKTGDVVENINIVEYQKYTLTTTTDSLWTTSRESYASSADAYDAAGKMITEIKNNNPNLRLLRSIESTKNSTGQTVYKYYLYKTSTTTETVEIATKTSTYYPTKYTYAENSKTVEKIITNIKYEDLASTADTDYKKAMEQHKEEIDKAAAAERAYEAAKKELDESLEKLNDVNDRIYELEAKLVTDEEIEKLRNEHTIALAKVDSAQDAKTQASRKIRQAEATLQRSEMIVDYMRNRRNIRIEGRGDIADTDGIEERGDIADTDGIEEKGDVADTDGIEEKGKASNVIFKDNTPITGASELLRKVAALNGASDSAAKKVYELVTKYKKTNINSLKEKAHELLPSLSPTSKVRLYIMLSKDYYLKNFNNPDFKFFNAEKYLEKYTDVKQAAIDSGESDLKAFALNHYLTTGIFEGRSSMTAFDPIKQIYDNPDKFNNVSLTDGDLPEAVFNLYAK